MNVFLERRRKIDSICSLASRSAFTLIELMLTLGIIAILVALFLPAVQMVREAARRTQCSDQIRQFALATQNFHSEHRILPGNGGRATDNMILSVNGQLVRPYTRDFQAGLTIAWGVASTEYGPKEQTGPWCFSIMPHIEMQSHYESAEFLAEIGMFLCPARSRGGPAIAPRFDSYGEYESGGHAMAKTDYVANGMLILNRGETTRFRDIVDGTSQTILFGEKAFDPMVQTPTSWYWDEPVYIGGSHGTKRSGTRIIEDKVGIEFRDQWGASHRGASHFAFADGHVDRLSTSTDQVLLESLLTPNSHDNP